MAALSESNSPNTLPMWLIAWIEGESGARSANAGPRLRHGVRSCRLVQAGNVAVHGVGGPFICDDAIDGDAAADGASVTLGAQISEERGVVGREWVRPRQGGVVDALGLGVFVL